MYHLISFCGTIVFINIFLLLLFYNYCFFLQNEDDKVINKELLEIRMKLKTARTETSK